MINEIIIDAQQIADDFILLLDKKQKVDLMKGILPAARLHGYLKAIKRRCGLENLCKQAQDIFEKDIIVAILNEGNFYECN
ncbi:MAG: hypothetical protein PVJ67_03920 [Candidatus Pacearchaeota archaeon]|jgi:hypothetical protein